MIGVSVIVAALGIGAGSTSTDQAKEHLASVVTAEKSENAVLKREVKRLRRSNHDWHRYARKVEREKGRLLHVVADLRSKLARLSPHPVSTAGHLAGWLCIHRREGAWNASTGNGYYGGLQMTYGWMGLVKDASKLSPAQQMAAAETGYRQSGYSDSWMRGQWPNTYPPCAGLF
jgi:hypothetical protein